MTAPTSPATATRSLFVVPHTHWDREWYRPFENYRFRLVETLDRVLGSALPYFLLDGQTAVLDDYLAMRPEAAETIRRRVAEGRVGVGPWYVLVDEFLVSGESLVRNLLEGRQAMRDLGATAAVGYLPDMFGHLAQMPQILRGFGLETAVVWRGANPRAPRFRWRSPDGSEVGAAWLPKGYYQTMLMEELAPEARQQQIAAYVAAFEGDGPVLLLSGADHMAPRLDTPALLAAIEEATPGLSARIVPLPEAVAGPFDGPVLDGELREPVGMAYVLPGVLSARTYLKQANAECQTLLERYAEPLAAYAWLEGRPYPGPFMRHAWRELMKNHPHDSICGCSIDQVHREMIPRFDAVRQVATEVLDQAARRAPKPQAAPGVFVFNPTGAPQTAWVPITIDWPLADAPDFLSLAGPDGAEVPVVLEKAEDTEAFCAEIDFNPDWFPVRRFHLSAKVALPALGGARLTASPEAPERMAAGVKGSDLGIENQHLVLRVEPGRLDLVDKASGQTYVDCHFFLDEGDAGDEYNFSPLAGDRPVKSEFLGARLVALRPHQAVLQVSYRFVLPVGLAADRQSRSAETRELIIRSRFTLTEGSRTVEVETAFDHDLHDHRLRVVANLGGGAAPRVWAESAFGVFERHPSPMPALPVAKGTEAVMPEFPQGGFTALEGASRALAVANHGLPEASLLETEAGWGLATTLVRAVGWLSRDDLRTRGGGAGPRFPTPEAQCAGRQVFRYALLPYKGAPGAWADQLGALQAYAAPARAWVGEGADAPGVALGNGRVVLSAFKRAEAGDAAVIRVFNPTPEPQSGTLAPGFAHRAILDADLAETPGAELGKGELAYALRPYEVRTWLVRV